MSLTGKTAIITGGAMGLGKAFAKRLAADGANIVIADLRNDDTRARIAADGGEVVGSTPEEFAAVLKRDLAKWTKVVKDSGARAD